MTHRIELPTDPRKLVTVLSTTRKRMLRRRVVIVAGHDACDDDIDDICQEVFDRILCFGGDHIENVEAWLWSVIESASVTWFRKCGYSHRNPNYSQTPCGDMNDYSPGLPAKRTSCTNTDDFDR